MYQAGINKIELYENKGLSFYYHDLADLGKITNLVNTGEVIEIENCQRPNFEYNIITGDNRKNTFQYIIEFFIFELSLSNIEVIRKLKESIYGFKPLVYFYDGTVKFYNETLFFISDSEIKIQEAMNYTCKLETRVNSLIKHLNYYPASALTYKCDTTILKCDTTLYTCDYY